MQRKRSSQARRVAIGLGLLALSAQGGAAQTAEQFYKGKTINFLVASVPGGVNDLTARLIARHLGKQIPGNPTIVVQNLQSSGLAMINRIYNTPEKDGLLIGIVERGAPQVAIMGDANARFDPLKVTWLGSVSSYGNDAYTLSVNSKFHAKTHRQGRTQAQHPACARLSRRRRRLSRAAAQRA
jgi:tripartite-type tricarboxylate transporter receptor subunit TctC